MKRGSALVLVGLGALLLGSRGGGSVSRHSGPVVPSSALPENYSRDELHKLRARWNDPAIRAAVLKWRDRTFPRIPITAMIAAGVTSTSRHERGGPPDFATGLWGVEWPRVERWAHDERTRRELGRAIPTEPSAFANDIEAQAYAGFRSYAEHLAGATRGWPGEIIPREGSQWLYRVALASYSSGEGKVSKIARAALDRIAQAGERGAWRAIGQAIVDAHNGGARQFGGVDIAGRWDGAHLVVRNEGRFQSGMVLAQNVADDEHASSTDRELARSELAWYADGWLPPELSRALASAAG